MATRLITLLLMCCAVASCGGDSPGDVTEREAAKLFDAEAQNTFGEGPPYSCRRTEGDETVEGIVDDIYFICTPLRPDGSECGVGHCAGYVVDFEDGKIRDYGMFGGP